MSRTAGLGSVSAGLHRGLNTLKGQRHDAHHESCAQTSASECTMYFNTYESGRPGYSGRDCWGAEEGVRSGKALPEELNHGSNVGNGRYTLRLFISSRTWRDHHPVFE